MQKLRLLLLLDEDIIHHISLRSQRKSQNSNLEQTGAKLFPLLPKFGGRPENLEQRRVNKPTKFDTTETLQAHIATFPPNNRSDNFCKILKGMRGEDLKLP